MSGHDVLPVAADALAGRFDGELLHPGDPDYDEARLVWNGLFDRHPAVIARCTSSADVAAAVGFARDAGLPLAVRGGGHSTVGFGTCDDGVVVDLSPMHAVVVDPVASTARAQGGTTWGQFDAATQEHGLAVTGGRFSTTGIAGLTLGSGSGWLERRCGLTADNLVEAEVVTADGRILRVNDTQHADLFWALHGGGGNFGVVTEFTYRLHAIGPLIYGGMLVCRPERAEAILRHVRETMPAAPDDLGLAVAFVSIPPEPFVPPEQHFAPAVGVVVCWSGDHAEGERVVAPLREVAQPMVDMVQPMPYVALQSMLDAGGPKGIRGYMKAEFLDELDDAAIAKLARHGARRAGPLAQLLFEPMGGAMRRVAEDATALGRRDVDWCYHALAMWMEPDAETEAAHRRWARELADDLRPHTTDGVYLNFTSDTGEERVRATFGDERFARLVAVKDRYDPDNLFRLNQNIRPSAGR
jgi:FAD/FMN-containing dehydrogenase